MPTTFLLLFSVGALWYYVYMTTVAAVVVRPDWKVPKLVQALVQAVGPRLRGPGQPSRQRVPAAVVAVLIGAIALVSQAVAVLILLHPSTTGNAVTTLLILAELLGAAGWTGYLFASLRQRDTRPM
jgi:hypothetical protein